MPAKLTQIVERLQLLGLSDSEARTYLAVVKLSPCRIAEIAYDARVQRTEVYRLMSRLVLLGLAQETIDRPKRYRAIDPTIAIPNLAKRTVRRFKSIETTAEDLASTLRSLGIEVASKTQAEVRVLTGRTSLRTHFLEVLRSARSEVWVMSGGDPILETNRSEFASYMKTISSRHLKVRFITELDEATAKRMKSQIGLIEIRHCPDLHSHLYGIDDHVVAIGLTPSGVRYPKQRSQVVISHNCSVKVIRSLFEAFWNNSTPFEIWLATRKEDRRILARRRVKNAIAAETKIQELSGEQPPPRRS